MNATLAVPTTIAHHDYFPIGSNGRIMPATTKRTIAIYSWFDGKCKCAGVKISRMR